jgi:hypothetical protein
MMVYAADITWFVQSVVVILDQLFMAWFVQRVSRQEFTG